MTAAQALELITELEGLIESGGRSDPPALRRIAAIIDTLKGTTDATGINASDIAQVHSWTQILFTKRKRPNAKRQADDIKNILRVHCIALRQTVRRTMQRANLPEAT